MAVHELPWNLTPRVGIPDSWGEGAAGAFIGKPARPLRCSSHIQFRPSSSRSSNDVREKWGSLRAALGKLAEDEKDSQRVLFEMSQIYRALSVSDKGVVDQHLAEWVLSPDEAVRFDAVALVSEHKIRSAMSALADLVSRLDLSREVGATFERSKVLRVIELLEEETG